MVHGNPLDLSSTSAEHIGAYAALRAVVLQGWKCEVISHLDNKGVVDRMEGKAKGMRYLEDAGVLCTAMPPAEWMKVSDPDVHWEMVAWAKRLQGGYRLVWHRGHPERRKKDRARWTTQECCMYRVDELAGSVERQEMRADWWDAGLLDAKEQNRTKLNRTEQYYIT